MDVVFKSLATTLQQKEITFKAYNPPILVDLVKVENPLGI